MRVAVEILAVAGGAVGLELKHGEHVHVVDPVAGLGREAVEVGGGEGCAGVVDAGLGGPLAVGDGEAHLEVFGIGAGQVVGDDGELERNGAEHGGVDVVAGGKAGGFGAAGEQRGEAGYEFVAEGVVVGELGEGEGAVPGADLGIVDGVFALERHGGEFFGESFADLLRGVALGPGGEIAGGWWGGLRCGSWRLGESGVGEQRRGEEEGGEAQRH